MWDEFEPRGPHRDYLTLVDIRNARIIYMRSYVLTYMSTKDYWATRQAVTYGDILYECDGERILNPMD